MSGEAPGVKGEEPADPHRLHRGAAADPGAQLPEVPLPVGAGAAHHRHGPAPLRDPGQDLVPEQTHQVEEGACAGERAGGRSRLQLTPRRCLLLSVLPAETSAAAVCAAAAAAASLSSVLQTALMTEHMMDSHGASPDGAAAKYGTIPTTLRRAVKVPSVEMTTDKKC